MCRSTCEDQTIFYNTVRVKWIKCPIVSRQKGKEMEEKKHKLILYNIEKQKKEDGL